jgi:hypothetical protein
MAATAGLFALLPLAPAAAAEPRTVVLTCDNGSTYTTLQRPGTAVFKDTQSRTVLVIQSVDDRSSPAPQTRYAPHVPSRTGLASS